MYPAHTCRDRERAISELRGTLCLCVSLYRGHRKWQGGNGAGGMLQSPSCCIPCVGAMCSMGAGRGRAWPAERPPPFLGRVSGRMGKGRPLLAKPCSLEQGTQAG